VAYTLSQSLCVLPQTRSFEVRGATNVTVRDVRIVNPGGSGMVLGGGARNFLVERTLIT
jgi:hypothetical protein